MKGKHIHENMLNKLNTVLTAIGTQPEQQVQVQVGERRCYADLVAELGGRRLVIEAEMSSQRIDGDLQKALALQATWLWIVVPNNRVKRSVRAKLRRLNVPEQPPHLAIYTISQAVQRLTSDFRC